MSYQMIFGKLQNKQKQYRNKAKCQSTKELEGTKEMAQVNRLLLHKKK